MSDVALACGFADQSHFTRVFTRMTGISPGAWRRGLEQGKVCHGRGRMNSKLGAPSCTSRAGVVGKCCFARFGRSNLRFLARVRTQTGGHPAYGAITVADENLKQSEQAT